MAYSSEIREAANNLVSTICEIEDEAEMFEEGDEARLKMEKWITALRQHNSVLEDIAHRLTQE